MTNREDKFAEAREGQRLWTSLTNKQRQFLEAYMDCEDEDKAVEISGISTSSLYAWRKQPKFMAAYKRVKKHLPVKVEDDKVSELLASEDEIRALAREELVALGNQIPGLLAELLSIAYHAKKDSDRLRAIEDAMQYLGLNKGFFQNNEGSMTLIQKKILKWTNPRSFPVKEETIEGDYKTLEDWAKESD